MKLLAILTSILVSIPAFCATWTLHGFKDNSSGIILAEGEPYSAPMYAVYWDAAWDVANPDSVGSGEFYFDPSASWSTVSLGYQNTFTITTADDFYLWWAYVSGPFGTDDYGVGQQLNPGIFGGGEFWLDFAADGSARLSTTQPSDFGKWAWDGSINPSWVEPLAKRGKTKGHH